jgi:hypothetical protein
VNFFIDVRSGVAVYPTDDTAFDQKLLSVDGNDAVLRFHTFQESIRSGINVTLSLGNILNQLLVFPRKAHFPATPYLEYHLKSLWKGL